MYSHFPLTGGTWHTWAPTVSNPNGVECEVVGELVRGAVGGLVKGSGRRNTERSAGGGGPAGGRQSSARGELAANYKQQSTTSVTSGQLFSCCSIAEDRLRHFFSAIQHASGRCRRFTGIQKNVAGVSGARRPVELTVETYPGPDVILLPCICGTVTVTQKLLMGLLVILLLKYSVGDH